MSLEDQLLGPVGLTAFLLLVVAYLGRTLWQFVSDYIKTLESKLDEALQLAADQTAANRVLADAQAARNRDDEMRHRLADVAGKAKVT